MAFDLIDSIVSTGNERAPATVTLAFGKKGTARCFVTVRPDLMAAIGATEKDRFEVLLGSGEHAGLLRLRRNAKTGIVSPISKTKKGGWFRFSLGHLKQLPNRGEKRQRCNAEAIDDRTIEIVLPAWARPAKPTEPRPAVPPVAQSSADVAARRARLGMGR